MNYKAVRLDRTSHYDRATRWPEHEGSIVSAGDGDFTRTADGCGPGIHSSPTLLQAVALQGGPSIYAAIEPIAIVQVSGNKTRSKAVKIDHWLSPEEMDELAGFKLWEANHPVNPLALQPTPFSDAELTGLVRQWDVVADNVWKSVRDSNGDSIGDSLWASILDSVQASVWNCVWDSISDSLWKSLRASGSPWASHQNSVGDSFWAYIGGLFPGITSWKGVERLGPDPWRPLLTLWYGGYLPSFDGETWRLHAGPDAAIVWEGKL